MENNAYNKKISNMVQNINQRHINKMQRDGEAVKLALVALALVALALVALALVA